MSTEMEQTDLSEKLEVIESPAAVTKMLVNLEKINDTPGLGPSMSNPRSIFRLRINLPPCTRPDLNQEYLASGYRAPLLSTFAIHPIGEGHHQESCHAYNQEHSSQETEKQMVKTAIQTKTELGEIDNKKSESPLFQQEQSLFRRAIRILLILLIILSLCCTFMIASQYVYLDVEGFVRSWNLMRCMNGFPKLRFGGTCSPPI